MLQFQIKHWEKKCMNLIRAIGGYPVLATLRGNAVDETAVRKLWEFSALATNLQFP